MNLFSEIRVKKPQRAKFDLSHDRKMSGKLGNIIPFMCTEIVPGDSFKVDSEAMIRFAPLAAPTMHRFDLFQHFFFVPTRLIWSEFENFITGGRLGTDAPVSPFINADVTEMSSSRWLPGSLADYMGLPAFTGGGSPNQALGQISALPFRAYQLIYDEYYRDQNVTPSINVPKTSGNVGSEWPTILSVLRRAAWEKDYQTSALPFQQRGTAVQAPITGTTSHIPGTGALVRRTDGSNPSTGGLNAAAVTGALQDATNNQVRIEQPQNVNGGFLINELRRSIKLQEWLERAARSGGRYIEQILAHFGVKSSDARLQRPQFLGGGKTPIMISEVLSTAQAGSIPQANMAGHGIGVGNTTAWQSSFEEHGYLIGVMFVRPLPAYLNPVQRMWRRPDKFDYLWPEFAHIGEQAVRNEEVNFNIWSPVAENPQGTFGFQSRYAEYKYIPSTVHGEFKTTLAFWHAARSFANPVVLNQSFIECDPTNRIFAVTDPAVDKLYMQVYNRVSAIRPLPYFDDPSMM